MGLLRRAFGSCHVMWWGDGVTFCFAKWVWSDATRWNKWCHRLVGCVSTPAFRGIVKLSSKYYWPTQCSQSFVGFHWIWVSAALFPCCWLWICFCKLCFNPFIWLCLIGDPGHEQIPSTYSLNLKAPELFCIQAISWRLDYVEQFSLKAGGLDQCSSSMVIWSFLTTSSSSFFEENWFWSFRKSRIKEPQGFFWINSVS
jgi:hypothetical protein